ncbi:hypothetical protein NQ318_003287 [Aromia moschata]|uniref:RNA methyltransferase n=1 Tax=Aromia moschata TaxID=1265417 RepID=A0AAV8YMM1_9CUCU|nr:hypothetical protein NQ318_003287 [Aromia moschata]
MENGNLQFKGGNPGAVQFGNFINYYHFHPPDERIKLLPKTIWNSNKACVALDIGCNTGDLTSALHVFLKNNVTRDCRILGVDIDPVLIRRAEETNKSDNISFRCINFMDQNSREKIIKEYLISNKLDSFNVVFCFSITMWIHLNNGDLGLKTFLKEVSSISEILIIEPQPWKCYKTAIRRMKKCNFYFPLFSKLQIRENVEQEIEKFLTFECDMKKIVETNRTKWERKLLVFRR